jgi:membrane dipeptidase
MVSAKKKKEASVHSEAVSEQARALHEETLCVDIHTHFLIAGHYLKRDFNRRQKDTLHYNPFRNLLDLPRAREGGLNTIVFTAYVPSNPLKPGARGRHEATLKVIQSYRRILDECSDDMVHVESAAGIREAKERGKIASFLAVEGGHSVGKEIEGVDKLYALGVRMLTLTHFVANKIADSSQSPYKPHKGLSDFGREVVQRMDELGIIPCVAHCSDAAIEDVLKVAKGPVISSHGGLRQFHDIKRNLGDDYVRSIAATGGLIGIILWPKYLTGKIRCDLSQLLDHFEYVAELVGPEHLSVGSDVDAATWFPREIRDVRDYPRITEGLLNRGFTADQIKVIWGGNFLRVVEGVCGS